MSDDNEHFISLVSKLTLEERQDLLEKLKRISNKTLNTLYFDNEPPETRLNIEEQFFRLPWYLRLAYYFKSLFVSKPPFRVFEDRQVILLQKKIDIKNPGLYDYESGKLLAPVFHQLNLLKRASRFFYSALDAGSNRDKGAFFAFLGSLEMPEVHTQIQDALNPALLEEQNPDVADSELKQIAFRHVEDALKGISEKERADMYYNARSLYCLKELTFFSFDRIILAFSIDSSTKNYSCSFRIVKDLLISLNNILFSFDRCPPLTLLESLFIFILQEKAGVSSIDINTEIAELLSDAEESLSVIRDFNMRVPLTKIIRCASRNASVQPREISGGEEWFPVFRDYWRNQAEKKMTIYLNERRSRRLHESFSVFLNNAEIKPFGKSYSSKNFDGIQLKGTQSLSFLRTFYSAVFIPDIDRILKPILVDGEFARKENRVEFNESYNVFLNIDDAITSIENKISPSGEYGQRLSSAKREMTSLTIKRRKLQNIIDEASTEAFGIIEEVCRSCQSMISLLKGIQGRDTTGKYGLMANYAQLSEKNLQFLNKINSAKDKFVKILEILGEMDSLRVL